MIELEGLSARTALTVGASSIAQPTHEGLFIDHARAVAKSLSSPPDRKD
jgi:hypothetical protein